MKDYEWSGGDLILVYMHTSTARRFSEDCKVSKLFHADMLYL